MLAIHRPEHDLIERLQGLACRGTFEAHVTIDAHDAETRDRFRAWCAERTVKCVLIELPEGTTRSQPMTATYHRGETIPVAEEVAALSRSVRAAGFAVTRVKLEAVATNEGLPDTDEEAAAFPGENYYEFHVKVLLAADADLGALRCLCAGHDARLSSNALKAEKDGRRERFVTLRVYHAGRQNAIARFEALVSNLLAAGYTLGNRMREYTLYDSAARLDAGWIGAA
jgi:hypothetical protein